MSGRISRRSRLSVRYFDDRILLTETHAWAYFRVPTISYEFMTGQQREGLAINLTVALAGIRMADAEVHLRIAHRSYPAAQWATELHATSDGGPGWVQYLDEMYRQVWAKDFWTKEVYLGVRLGQRGVRAQLAGGMLAQFVSAYRTGEQLLGLEDDAVSASEIAKWTEHAERVGRTLGASSLAARHASADDVAWLFRHAMLGAVGDSPPSASRRRKWGQGEIESLVEGEIHNGRTVLKMVHPAGESYSAFMSFSRFPDVMYFPDGEPWLHYADALPFPVEASMRMRLIPPAKASKDVSRRLAHARDMDAHIREAGADLPIALAEQIEAARLLEHGITKERLPFVYGWHRLVVTATTRELCVRRAEAVTEHYRDIGIDVVNSTGDQFSLLNESLPGDKVRLPSYLQRQPLYTISGGMPTATVDLGDRVADGAGWVGPYIGETLGRARSVVHFDPLVAAARNRPTAVAITGEPGGGKTTLALLLIMQLALRGVTTAVIDPKGDAESLVRLLQARGRRARVLPLGSAAAGLLDPFSFGDDLAERRTMAAETLRLLLPGMSEERESAMIQAVGAVSGADRPSLGRVVEHLEQAAEPAAKNLGAVLRSMSEMRLAKLCFAPSGGAGIDAAGWTTVFTLAGLTLPDATLKRDDYSYEQRLSVALLYLVSQFARRLLNGMDRRLPKAIVLDEAWAVTSTPQGAKLIPEVSRMGRSRNTALIMVSQNAGDLLNEQVTNCISAVFAFRSTERAEVASVMSLLGVDPSDEHQAVLRGLGNAECIFRDLDGRAGRIGVDLISDDLRHWLDTNPTRTRAGEVPLPSQAHGVRTAPGPWRPGGPPTAAGQQRAETGGPPQQGSPGPATSRPVQVHGRTVHGQLPAAGRPPANGQPQIQGQAPVQDRPPSPAQAPAPSPRAATTPPPGAPPMPRLHRLPRKTAVALVLVAVGFNVQFGAHHQARAAVANGPIAARTLSATFPVAATSPAAATSPGGGPCSVPGIGDIGGLLGFCSLGSSGLTGDLNNLCQPGVPQPEPATSGVDALIKPPAPPGKELATPYNQYGMSGQFWAATNLQCSDMTSLIGNDVAGMLFDFAKAMDRVTITVYQSAAGGGILSWLQAVANHLISGLGNAIYFPYVAVVVIIAAIWLAWQGLIRKRGTRTIEGTIWMVVACAAAIWLIGRPADFTGLGKGISDGISATLNTAFAHLPSPGQASCLPVAKNDPQISPASFSYTSGRTVVDQNANELWTVLVCKPWLDGEFGTTTFATAAGAKPTPVNTFGRQLLWAQAIAANEPSTAALVQAKQAAYGGIASTIQRKDADIYPLFQGKQWTTRLEIAFAALLAAVVAGVLVLLISVTLILLKLGFLLLLIVGPFFLLVGTHPGFGRVVAVRWFEMLVGVLLKQAAVALALSVLLYCYALIMGTTDAVLPWALKILMITLVTAAVFIYRKPFQHLFAAVGYGAIGSTDRAEADLSRAAATARANTRSAATIAVPGFAAYRAARWARRNPAQAAGLALGAATAVNTSSMAAGLAAGSDGSVPAGADPHEYATGGVPSGAGSGPDPAGASGAAGAASRARAWGASAGTSSASEAPPLRLPAQGSASPPRWPQNGSASTGTGSRAGSGQAAGNGHAAASAGHAVPPPARPAGPPLPGSPSSGTPVSRRPGPASAARSWTSSGSPPSAPRPLPQTSAQPPRQAAEPARQAPPLRHAPPPRQAAEPRQSAPPRQPRPAGLARRGRPASGRPFGGGSNSAGPGPGGGADRRGEPPALPLSGPGGGPGGGLTGGPAGAPGSEQPGPFWLRPIWRRKS